MERPCTIGNTISNTTCATDAEMMKHHPIEDFELDEEMGEVDENELPHSEEDDDMMFDSSEDGDEGGSNGEGEDLPSKSTKIVNLKKEMKKNGPPPMRYQRGRHRIKLDYGWKTLLRGMRQCLREGMETSSMFTGRHHWND